MSVNGQKIGILDNIYEFRLFPDFYSFVYFVDIHFCLVAKNRCVVELLLNRNLIINKW